MSTDADRTIDALQSGHDDLARLVPALTPEQLTNPSGASEWDVSQVLGHLGSGAVITKAGLNGILSGTGNPAPDFNQGVWHRWNAMTPQERADGFLAADEALLAVYHGIDDQTRDSLRTDLGFLPEPVGLAVAAGFRLNEFTLHSWDARVAFDPAATLRPEATALLLDRVAFLLGWIGKPAALDGSSGTLLVRLNDPEREFGLQLGEGVSLVPAPAQPDGVLTAPAEAWLRLATGRLSAEHTPLPVEVTGDIDLATLRRVFPGF
jgi:uncharacterized protein (TIGR03083 family)